MKKIFAAGEAVLAISIGVIVLLGYFIAVPAVSAFRAILFQWAVILAAVAVLIGMLNLFSVHLKKIRERQPGAIYSFILLFFMLLTILASVTPALQPFKSELLNGIMVPVEISLLAVLAVTLLYASLKLVQTRRDMASILFIATALLILLGMGSWPFVGQLPFFGNIVRPFISNVLAVGGARGILIGIALGTLTTGLRIFFGVDRPYGGK